MKALKILIFIPLLFIGCGVSYHDEVVNFSYVDNREQTNFFNPYGYFGYDVIFGEQYIVGDWVLYHTSSDDILFARFFDDAEVMMGDASRYEYGVSRDGLSIYVSTGELIEIISSNIYKRSDGYDCYRVEISSNRSSSRADMCPKY
ncbi:MAG: hypothetical protein K0U38_05395 [Epsilonproteobacteria bacterium]|nr:hypothetical protein [Campylobacterota bacterium]